MKKLDISEATEPLADYVQKADEGPLVVTAAGQPIAVVVGVENADLETVVMSNHPKFLELIERSRARQEREGGIPAEDIRHLFDAG